MAQKNRANMLTDIVSNIYNNLINFITGQNAQDRFVNLLDSSPNILSDKDQTDGYVGTDSNNEILSIYYNENDSRANIITKSVAGLLVANKFYQINDAVGGTIALQVCAENALILHNFAIDLQTGEIGTYDITTDVFSPIVSSAQTLAQTLILGNTSGANDIEFDATQGLLFSNTSRLREGTIDAGLGGQNGIAQICGVGYELKWEAGRLYVMGSSGNTIRQSLYNFNIIPTTDEDNTLGYSVGSLWTLDDGTTYVCSDATTGSAVWDLVATTPTLEEVLTEGNTSTIPLKIDDGAGNSFEFKPDVIKIVNPLGGNGQITSSTLTSTTAFNLPNKAAGTQTFAMLSDITSWDSTLVSSSLTAVLSTQYVVVASATFTDPSPVEGKGFQVYVRNGTATIGGVGYSVVGSVIWRVFHSGSWATYLINEITASSTNTLTNKRITARTGTTTSSATPTINTDNVDFYSLTAQTVDITSFTTNLSGTPTDAQTLWIAITGTAARAITWGASFESSTITLPTTTVTTARLDVAFIWNAVSGKWRCVGVA